MAIPIYWNASFESTVWRSFSFVDLWPFRGASQPPEPRSEVWWNLRWTLTFQSLLFSFSSLFSFFSLFHFAVFLVFLCVLLFFQGFLGLCREDNNPCFLGGSSLFLPNKQGLEGQGSFGGECFWRFLSSKRSSKISFQTSPEVRHQFRQRLRQLHSGNRLCLHSEGQFSPNVKRPEKSLKMVPMGPPGPRGQKSQKRVKNKFKKQKNIRDFLTRLQWIENGGGIFGEFFLVLVSQEAKHENCSKIAGKIRSKIRGRIRSENPKHRLGLLFAFHLARQK